MKGGLKTDIDVPQLAEVPSSRQNYQMTSGLTIILLLPVNSWPLVNFKLAGVICRRGTDKLARMSRRLVVGC